MFAHRILQEFLREARKAGYNGDSLLTRLQGGGKVTKKEKDFLANLSHKNPVSFNRQVLIHQLKVKPCKL